MGKITGHLALTASFFSHAGTEWISHDDDTKWKITLHFGQRCRVPGAFYGK